IRDAMEKQRRAEREKRALIAESEGDKQAKIKRAEGERQQMIAVSEGEKQKRINEAQGHAAEIELVAQATAGGLRVIAQAINENGGREAVTLRVAENYLVEFGKLAKTNNTMIVPANLSELTTILALAGRVLKGGAEEFKFDQK
ncbi:MAG: paraslipin, partial [Deltaproteobacteria bacterium]|nr:paraslipin [Deltaproteobacteria bacterium]